MDVPTEDKIKELEHVFDQLTNYHMKNFLGDFNVEIVREDTFRTDRIQPKRWGFDSQQGQGLFFYATASIPDLEPTQPPMK
jgi:hypothetical protein